MKVTTSWIQSLLGRTISDREIADALERAGIEIEQYSYSKKLDENIVAGLVRSTRQHPEADRLKIAEVYDGSETYEVVCGAPNVRPDIVVPFARVGSYLPSGDQITKAKLRGVVSQGMLCSGRELELPDDHDGLLELEQTIKPGTLMASLYPADGTIHIKTAANRWDVLSVIGLAREVAGQVNTTLNQPNITELKMSAKRTYIGSLETSVSRFCVAELRFDAGAATPEWIIQRLAGAGIRGINLVVDITNYVMLEYGQPLHAYNVAAVRLPLSVRHAEANEKLMTLDGVPRVLSASDLVVADAEAAVGLAGVMGGADSEVKVDTGHIYLEAATFDGATVRKAAKRHGLRSEASARFERGLPLQLAPLALARAVDLLVEYAHGKVLHVEDKQPGFAYEYRTGIRASYASSYLGVELSRQDIVQQLAKLEIAAVPFDIAAEARKHIGKPYVWGASFRKCRDEAFDCSYLTDYLYSLIGLEIGHTSLGQYEVGRPVEEADLQPGDILFYRGNDGGDDGQYDLDEVQSDGSAAQPHSIRGSYYMRDYRTGGYQKIGAKTKGLVGHNGIYVGDGKVVHAARYEYVDGAWRELEQPGVVEVPVEYFTGNPTYIGARRYVEHSDDWVAVPTVPWWRADIKLEEDLLEELARLIGYDKIPSTIPAWHPREVEFDRVTQPVRRMRQLLSGLGLYEVMTYSFVSGEQIARSGGDVESHMKLQNPLSSEQEYLRRDLLASHMTVLEQNRKIAKEVGFYEISGVFHDRGKDLPFEPTMLGVTVAVPSEGYRYVKGIWDHLSRQYGLDFQLMANEGTPYAVGRSVSIMVRGTAIGTMGQLAPRIERAYKAGNEVARFEINLDAFLAASRTQQYDMPSKYPSVNRDITMLVPSAAQWQHISKTVNAIPGVSAAYGGDYYGDELPENYRALTLRLAMTSSERTLTDDEAAILLSKVEQTLRSKYKAKSRD